MGEQMTIGQLAKATGIPQTTIRFYEREGLLLPEGRSSGNYRLYSRAAAERLTFVRTAQAAGFKLPEVKAILALGNRPGSVSESERDGRRTPGHPPRADAQAAPAGAGTSKDSTRMLR